MGSATLHTSYSSTNLQRFPWDLHGNKAYIRYQTSWNHNTHITR